MLQLIEIDDLGLVIKKHKSTDSQVLSSRGLGNLSSTNSLCDLVRKYSPKVLFLSETKSSAPDIRNIQCNLRFEHSDCVEAVVWLEVWRFSHFLDGLL